MGFGSRVCSEYSLKSDGKSEKRDGPRHPRDVFWRARVRLRIFPDEHGDFICTQTKQYVCTQIKQYVQKITWEHLWAIKNTHLLRVKG